MRFFKDLAAGVPGRDVIPPFPPRTRPGARGLRGLSGPSARWFGALGEEQTPVLIPGIPRAISGPSPDPGTFRKLRISTGSRGTDETLDAMADMSLEAAEDPYFVSYFREVVKDCPARDYYCIAQTLLDWSKSNIKYVNDSLTCELVQSPGYLSFVSGRGDCDCLSCQLAAAFLACGLGAGYKAIATNANNPSEFSHVFALAGIPTPSGVRWLAADAVMDPMGPAILGQEPPESAYVMRPNVKIIASP